MLLSSLLISYPTSTFPYLSLTPFLSFYIHLHASLSPPSLTSTSLRSLLFPLTLQCALRRDPSSYPSPSASPAGTSLCSSHRCKVRHYYCYCNSHRITLRHTHTEHHTPYFTPHASLLHPHHKQLCFATSHLLVETVAAGKGDTLSVSCYGQRILLPPVLYFTSLCCAVHATPPTPHCTTPLLLSLQHHSSCLSEPMKLD